MKILLLTLLVILGINKSFSQLSENEYLEKCDFDIKRYSERTNTKEKWLSKLDSINTEYVRIGTEFEKNKKYYGEDNNSVYSFQYLKEIYSYLLPEKTNLLNNIGKQLLKETVEIELMNKIDSLDFYFNSIANTETAIKLQNLYNQFLNIKTDYLEKGTNPKVAYSIIYKPVDNAYSDPVKVQEYFIYDWDKSISESKIIDKRLNDLLNQIQTEKFIIIKEPLPFIPLCFQFATLLILISNLLVNFGFEAKTKTVVAVVVTFSIITSLILLFVSSNTIMNSVINVFMPGGMYLIYYSRHKKSKKNCG